MKTIIISAIFFLVSTLNGASQTFEFGLKAGVNLATISGNVSDLDTRTGLLFGVVGEFDVWLNFSIQPELLYSTQGFKADGDTVKIDYLNLPIMGKYYVAEGLSLEFGPQLGLLLSANSEIDDEGDVGYQYSSIDFGINFGLGYKLESGLNFGIRYNLGLANMANFIDEIFNDYKIQNSVFQISVGYNIF